MGFSFEIDEPLGCLGSRFLMCTAASCCRAYRVTCKRLECEAVESAQGPYGVPGGTKGLSWGGLYCRRLSLSEGGSQADNLNEIKTIRFWVRYRKSVGRLSITLPKRLGPEMVQRP